MVLLNSAGDNSQVIRAAILGSILANMLLCLGACFIAGGITRHEQTFHPALSEAGSGLMLVAGSRFCYLLQFEVAVLTPSSGPRPPCSLLPDSQRPD